MVSGSSTWKTIVTSLAASSTVTQSGTHTSVPGKSSSIHSSAVPSSTKTPSHPAPAAQAPVLRFPYGSTPVRGVNIGGWLVLEPWITPSLFTATGNTSVVDEWTYGENAKKNSALATALTQHWNTWYTEQDFADIAAAGLNHVRIPIGFWAFDISGGEPYLQGQYPYLLKAVQWAANHGLKVLVDLHGVPGSQNGFDNSGHLGPALWATQQSNIDRTNAIVKMLAHEFSQSKYASAVTSIAPINEPASFKSSAIVGAAKNLYQASYNYVRQPFTGSNTVGNLLLVIHDAFEPLSYWNGYMTDTSQYQGVALDTHSYGVFSNGELQQTWGQHISSKCQLGSQIGSFAKNNLWTIVGEWSLASTDCAKWLNGRNTGSRYDGTYPGSSFIGTCGNKTGSASGFSSSYKTFLRKNFEAQSTAYEQGQGWIYWCYKVEDADDWSYQAGVQNGWIPKNPAEKIYGNQCNY